MSWGELGESDHWHNCQMQQDKFSLNIEYPLSIVQHLALDVGVYFGITYSIDILTIKEPSRVSITMINAYVIGM